MEARMRCIIALADGRLSGSIAWQSDTSSAMDLGHSSGVCTSLLRPRDGRSAVIISLHRRPYPLWCFPIELQYNCTVLCSLTTCTAHQVVLELSSRTTCSAHQVVRESSSPLRLADISF